MFVSLGAPRIREVAATGAALGAALLFGFALPTQPTALLGVAAALAAAAFALGLQKEVGLTAWWPLGVIAVLQPLNGIRPLPSVAIGDFALVALAVICTPMLRRMHIPKHVLVPLLGTMVLTAGGILGMLATQDWSSAVPMVKFLVGAPMVILILSALNPTPRFATGLAQMYALGAVISTIGAMSGKTDPYFQRAMGYSAHQLHLALSTMFATVLAIGWFASTQNRWSRAAAALMGSVCLYGMLLTGARSALIAFVLAVGYLAVLGRKKGIVALVAVGSAAGVVLVAAMPFMPQGSTLYRLTGQGELSTHVSASDNLHVQAAMEAVDEIAEHPWTGLGFANGLDAHNLLLEATNVGGVLGIVGFCMIWGTILALAYRQLRYGIRRRDAMRASMIAGILGYFVLGQLENIIWDRHLWFYLTLALFALPPTLADPDDGPGEAGDEAGPEAQAPATTRAPAGSSAWTAATSQ